MTARANPTIIQGGMGVAVSNWRLASAVARTGQMGVVSGTVLDTVMVTATVGLPQVRPNGVEPPIVTSGDDLLTVGRLAATMGGLSAARVVRYLQG